MTHDEALKEAKRAAVDCRSTIAVVDTIDDFGDQTYGYAPPHAVTGLYGNWTVIGTFSPDGEFTASPDTT